MHLDQLTSGCHQCPCCTRLCRRLLLPRPNGPKNERPGPLPPAPRGAIKTDTLQYDDTTLKEVGVVGGGICPGAPMHSSAGCNRAFVAGDAGVIWIACDEGDGAHAIAIRDGVVMSRQQSPPFYVAYRHPQGTIWLAALEVNVRTR